MRKTVFFLLFLMAPLAGQEVADQENLKTTKARYPLGKYEIVIRQQHRIKFPIQERLDAGVKPYWCSAFVEIWKNGEIIDQLTFQDIHPLGWKYGIYLPLKQESPKHFILMKYGSYDCRTLVITDEGKLFNLGGGSYRIFQNRYLITPRELPDTDGNGEFSIFDLLRNKVLVTPSWRDLAKDISQYPTNDTVNIIKFFTNGPDLFAGIVQVDHSWRVLEHTSYFYRIDLETGKLLDGIFDIKNHKEIVIDYSNIDLSNDCECVKKADKS